MPVFFFFKTGIKGGCEREKMPVQRRGSGWKWVVTVAVACNLAGAVAAPQLTTVVPARNDAACESFTFAVVGDSQPKDIFGQPEVFKKIIGKINESPAEFLVHLGDKISGSRKGATVKEQYAEYLDIVKELKAPVWYTVGNHEIAGMKSNEDIHRDLFGHLYYSFVHNKVLFIVLNTEHAGKEGSISGRQMEWLKNTMERGKDCKYSFVFLHKPLFSALTRHESHRHYVSKKHRDELAELFKNYKVSAVFAGHEHLYHSGIHAGLVQVISGGGGAPFHFYPEGNFHHYLLVEVTDKNAVIRSIPVNY